MKKYYKPNLKSYSADSLCEIIGPVQTASVELQIQFQQLNIVQLKPETKIEKVIMLAKKEKPKIFNLNNIA